MIMVLREIFYAGINGIFINIFQEFKPSHSAFIHIHNRLAMNVIFS